ncbi:hypothetical protein FDECE_955 [Fusarium decemcellulare]|nr:hypothetical protein FDECE_955 [Fusarium decemcellulare]
MATTAAPHIKAIRQEAQVITQTVSLPSTTFTTHVTLGVAATDRPDPVVTSHHSNPNGLTDAQIGAIAGTVVGVFLLVLIVLCCCCRQRSRHPREVTIVTERRRKRGSYGSSYASDGWSEPSPLQGEWIRPIPMPTPRPMPQPTPVQHPAPVYQPEQIPGGPKYPTYRAIPIPNPRNPSNYVPRYR